MTIASEVSKVAYSGNGSTTRFAIPFPFLRQEDLKVLLRSADGTEANLVQSTHFSFEEEEVGGTCIMNTPPESEQTLVIKRDPDIVQGTVYEEGVPLSAKAREDALDLVTMICQANRERVDRAVKFSPTSPLDEAVMPDPQGGMSIVWNGDGTSLENGPTVTAIESANENAIVSAAAQVGSEAARDQAVAAKDAAEAARDLAQAVANLNADGVEYSNTTSGLTATHVQGALDELAYDTEVLSGMGRQMSLGFFQLMASQSMAEMDITNRALHTFEDSSGIDTANSTGYVHDADNDLVKPASSAGVITIDFSDSADFVQEDVKESITTFVVDTVNASGHFTDGTTAQKLVGDYSTDTLTGGTITSPTSGASGIATAIDGSTSDNMWFSNLKSGALVYDYGAGNEVVPGKVRLFSRPNAGTIDWKIEGSNDNSTWTELYATTGSSSSVWVEGICEGATAYRYVKLTIIQAYGSGDAGISEWEVLGLLSSDAPKVILGTRVVTAAGEVVITGVTNQGDGTNEVAFSGTLAAGNHTVTGIYGTAIVAGKAILSGGSTAPIDTLFSCVTDDIDASTWTDINSVSVAETLNSQTALYALSFDGGTTYKAWDGDSMETVTYPCPDAGTGWMNGTTLVALADSALPAPTGNVRVAVALKTTDSSASPEVDTITINADAQPSNMSLQLNTLETTGVPDKATVLAVVKEVEALTLNTDLIAEVSRDGGTTWQSLSLTKVADFLTDRITVEGKADFSHADGGNTQAMARIKSDNGKGVELHYMSLGVVI